MAFNNAEWNGQELVTGKDIATPSEKIINECVYIKPELVATVFDNVETNYPRQIISNDLGASIELPVIR